METLVSIIGGLLMIIIPVIIRTWIQLRKEKKQDELIIPSIPDDLSAVDRARIRVQKLRSSSLPKS